MVEIYARAFYVLVLLSDNSLEVKVTGEFDF